MLEIEDSGCEPLPHLFGIVDIESDPNEKSRDCRGDGNYRATLVVSAETH
jgi:hypothetical protein